MPRCALRWWSNRDRAVTDCCASLSAVPAPRPFVGSMRFTDLRLRSNGPSQSNQRRSRLHRSPFVTCGGAQPALSFRSMHAEDPVDCNRLLLKEAEIARGLTRQAVTMSAANRLVLHETAWLWVHLQRTRVGLLADIRHSLARARCA
jgi:hypothetical protein